MEGRLAVALALVLAYSCHRAEAAEAPTDAAAARAFLERWSEAARDGRLDETTREQFARAALSLDETQRDAQSAEWLATTHATAINPEMRRFIDQPPLPRTISPLATPSTDLHCGRSAGR